MPSIKKQKAVAVARASQTKDPVQIADARRELAMANIQAAIERNVAKAPPFTPEQVKLLTGLLRTGGQR